MGYRVVDCAAAMRIGCGDGDGRSVCHTFQIRRATFFGKKQLPLGASSLKILLAETPLGKSARQWSGLETTSLLHPLPSPLFAFLFCGESAFGVYAATAFIFVCALAKLKSQYNQDPTIDRRPGDKKHRGIRNRHYI